MSDTRKSVVFSAKLDTSDIGPTIENLKRQFNEASNLVNKNQGSTANRLNKAGFGGLMSMPNVDEIQKSKRALDQFVREQAQQQEKLYKLIENQKDKIEKLQNIKRSMLKDSKEELSIEEKKVAAQEQLIRLNDQYRQRDANLNKALDLRGGGGGGGGANWGGIAKGIGTAASVLSAASAAVERMAGYPMRVEEARGSAAQSFVGRDISAIQNGSAVFEMPWMKERARAAEMARSKRGWNHLTDIGMGLGGAALIGGGALATATGAGALLGGGMVAAGGAILSNDRYRSSINPFGQGGYNQLLNAQQGQDTLSTWESLKQQDPQKRAAIERLQGRYSGDLQSQRMMGLGYNGFAGPGGFQETANGAGFTDVMAMAMASQIQGAGGSTRGMRSLSTLGLQAQRGFDLTNSGGVLGRISGQVGGGAASEQVFRRLMEESIKAGLDKSEFAEEQRRFADVTSEILASAGVKTAEESSSVLQGFSKYLGEAPTVRGMQGAMSSYQEQQSFSAETGGRGGALQIAGMLKDPVLGNLSPRAMSALAEMPEQDINPSNPRIISLAAQAGVSPQEFVESAQGMKYGKRLNEVGLNSGKVEKMYQTLSSMGIRGAIQSPEQMEALRQNSPEDFQTYNDVVNAGTMKNEYGGPQKAEADIMRYARGGGGVGSGVYGPAAGGYDERLGAGTGRPEDEVNRANGAAAQAMLENFRNFKDEITPATAALTEFISAIIAVKTAAGGGSGKDSFSRYMNAVPSTLRQTQGGKPAGK